MKLGADYYPEHWDETLWRQDAALMKETGIDVIRVAEFAWSRLEPADGMFDFTWLDRVIAVFAEHGIGVVLGTPTACPPLWLFEEHPDIAKMDHNGFYEKPGVRGHRCYHSPSFRPYMERIVRRMAEHYAGDPSVVAWQIDNEVDASYCCCPTCVRKFRQYLHARYASLDALNSAWHTDVWSGTYSDWRQIRPPLSSAPMSQFNPALVLDFKRFAAESCSEYVRLQTDLIRSVIPGAVITTNTWFPGQLPDFYRLYDSLDFVSYDNYPSASPERDDWHEDSHAFHLDLIRGVRQRPFWIMEELSGSPGCWFPMRRTPAPGMLKGYAMQAIARGADAVVQFRWRSACGGAEMYWHGLIDHANVPGRRLGEFADFCREAKKIGDVTGMMPDTAAAILYSPDQEYGFGSQLQSEGMHYLDELTAWHRALTRLGVQPDVISQEAPFDRYRLVIAPDLYIHNETTCRELHRFAENGGTVLLTCRCGVKDEHNNCLMMPLPGPYADMCGLNITEYDPLGTDTEQVVMDGIRYSVTRWADLIACGTAEPVACYDSAFYKGTPAVTVNRFGAGSVYYIGTHGCADLCMKVTEKLCVSAGITVIPGLPEGVEITRRGVYTFVFNNNAYPVSFCMNGHEIILGAWETDISKE